MMLALLLPLPLPLLGFSLVILMRIFSTILAVGLLRQLNAEQYLIISYYILLRLL